MGDARGLGAQVLAVVPVEEVDRMKPYYEDGAVTIYHGDCRDILPSLTGSKLVVTSPPYGVEKSYELGISELEWEYLVRSAIAIAADTMQGGDFMALNLPDRLVFDEWLGMRPAAPLVWRDIAQNGLYFYDRRTWLKNPCWSTSQWHSSSVKAVQETEDIFFLRKKGYTLYESTVLWAVRDAMHAAGMSERDVAMRLGVSDAMVKWWSRPGEKNAQVPSLNQWERLSEFLPLDRSLDALVQRHHRKTRDRLTEAEWTEWGSRQVWKLTQVGIDDKHPAAFPLALAHRCIRLLSEPETIVVDPFMGSGTALRAAKDLGRKAIGIEIDEKFCEVAANRLSQEVLGLDAA